MLSYYVIYYEKFRKVMQQTKKVALIPIMKAGECTTYVTVFIGKHYVNAGYMRIILWVFFHE